MFRLKFIRIMFSSINATFFMVVLSHFSVLKNVFWLSDIFFWFSYKVSDVASIASFFFRKINHNYLIFTYQGYIHWKFNLHYYIHPLRKFIKHSILNILTCSAIFQIFLLPIFQYNSCHNSVETVT